MNVDHFYNREIDLFNFLKAPEILVEEEKFTGGIYLRNQPLFNVFETNRNVQEKQSISLFIIEEIMRRNILKLTAIKKLDELERKKEYY